MRLLKQLGSIILLLAWMIVIYRFSDQPNSNDMTENMFGGFNYFVRKGAHMAEFGILFCLALNCFVTFQKQHFRRERIGVLLRILTVPVLFSIFYAITDEWHQSFVPGRSAVYSDVAIDSIGIVIAAMLSLVAQAFRRH